MSLITPAVLPTALRVLLHPLTDNRTPKPYAIFVIQANWSSLVFSSVSKNSWPSMLVLSAELTISYMTKLLFTKNLILNHFTHEVGSHALPRASVWTALHQTLISIILTLCNWVLWSNFAVIFTNPNNSWSLANTGTLLFAPFPHYLCVWVCYTQVWWLLLSETLIFYSVSYLLLNYLSAKRLSCPMISFCL